MITQNLNSGRIISRHQFRKLLVLSAAAGMLAVQPIVGAASLSWDPTQSGGTAIGGGGNWDTADPFWYNGTADVAWNSDTTGASDTAVFDGTAGIVSLTTAISAGNLTFNTTGYTIGGTSTLTLGSAPVITLASGVSDTISAVVATTAQINVTGAGQLTLSGNNTFSGGMLINGGAQVNFSSETPLGSDNVGASGKTITLDNGTLSYTGTVNSDITAAGGGGNPFASFVINAGGGTINMVNPGSSGGGAKISVAASALSGSGTLNVTGQGILTTNGTETGFTGTVNVNGGWVELNSATGLGSTAAIININTGGELAIKGAGTAYNLNVNGGNIGADGASGTFSGGTLTFSGNSGIRLGYFYSNTNDNLTVADALAGSGTIGLLNGLNWNTTTNTATQIASTGNQLILSGTNSAFTGTLVVDGNHAVVFNNANAYLTAGTLSAVTTAIGGGNALPIVGLNFVTSTTPTITDNTAGAGGVLAMDAQTNYNSALNMSTVGAGEWFLGSIGSSTYTASSLGIGAANTYRLGGGGGTLTIPNNILVDSGGPAAVVFGSSLASGTVLVTTNQTFSGGATVNGGTVIFNTNQTYGGGTTINGGTLQLGTGGTTGNVTGAISINSPGVLVYDHSDNLNINSSLSGTGTISNIGTGSLTFSAANSLSLTVSGMENIGATGSFNAPTLNLSGGTVNIQSSAASDTFAATNVNPGASAINGGFASGSNTFALGAITRNVGGTVNFTPLTTGAITTTTPNTNGILGGWATYNGTTWAINDGSGPPGNIAAFPAASYVADAWAAGSNTDDTINDSPASGSTTNSLRFNTSGANTLTLAGTNTITSGGILETANVGANAVTITGGTLEAGGTSDLVINQFNTGSTMTIASIVAGGHGVTKSGPGTTLLTSTANSFTGNLYINGGALAYNVDTNLGATANQIYLNSGGTLDMAAGANISIARTINVGASGGGIEVAVSGDGGATTGGKLTMGTANQLNGTGTVTFSGLGILTISAAQTNYNGAGWIINGGATPGGVVEDGIANGLGGNSVPVTINANGELADKIAVSNPITLNGGTLGADGTSGSYSGPITVNANSSIRAGFFYTGTNNNLTISSAISGAGNLTILNGQTWGAVSNPVPTQVAGSGSYLTLSGNNTNYTGSLIVNGGQGVLFNAANSVTNGNGTVAGVTANASATGMPLISMGSWDGNTAGTVNPPAIVDNTGTTGGVFAINTGSTSESNWYSSNIDESNLGTGYDGYWFLGSQSGAIYNGNSLGVGANNTYRLGGGGGLLYVYNDVLQGNATLQIGAPMVNGGGSVQLAVAVGSYGGTFSGPVNIVNGTLLMGNNDPVTPLQQNNTLPTTTVITFGGVNGTTQYSGTLDLRGDNQELDTAQSLNVAAGATPGNQVITSNGSYGGAGPANLIIDTTQGNTEWDGVIKDGTGQVALTIQGSTPGNGMILTGNNAFTGATSIGSNLFLKIGNGGTTGALTGPVTFNGGNTLTINTQNSFTNNGLIQGTGQIVQSGSGATTFSYPDNTYTGGTTISAGKVVAYSGMASDGGSSIGAGNVTLGGGTLALGPTSIPGNASISGFGGSGTGWQVNNNATTSTPITSNVLTLTDGGLNQARSAFYTTPVTISNTTTFTASFTYTEGLAGPADGFTFTLQDIGPTALGANGGNIGWGPAGGGIGTNSAAVQFEIYNQFATGWGTDGALNDKTNPLFALVPGDPLQITLTYNGTAGTLIENVVDSKVAGDSDSFTYTGVDLPSILTGVDGSIQGTAYVGFTGGAGDSASTQTISNFSFSSSVPPPTYSTSWTNPVDVTANSVSGIQINIAAASMSQLTLESGSTLSVTTGSGLPSNTAYTLTFASTTNNSGTETINVADNGTGKGTVILTALSGSGNITKGGPGILQLPGAGSLPTVLTINAGVVAIPYTGASPVSSIANDIKAAYDLGAWDKTNTSGPTITTAAATKLGTTLGYLDTGSAVDVMYTWYGDLNLDGVVNGSDLTAMTNGNGSSWSQGDLNFDGVENADDWALFMLGNAVQDGSIPTGVPEPTTLGLLVAAGALALRRRRSV